MYFGIFTGYDFSFNFQTLLFLNFITYKATSRFICYGYFSIWQWFYILYQMIFVSNRVRIAIKKIVYNLTIQIEFRVFSENSWRNYYPGVSETVQVASVAQLSFQYAVVFKLIEIVWEGRDLLGLGLRTRLIHLLFA